MKIHTAEPPRKDSGELLLNKLFLDACSAVYAVFPGGQENQGQPFVSKHFNVIDPLRTNNNLGRSVSKGMLLIFFTNRDNLVSNHFYIAYCLFSSLCNIIP